MVRDTPLMVMHPHTKYHWPISKDKKCYGPNKKILFKKQLFDLEVKGQDPTKVIMVCNTSPYGHAPTYQISLTYLERNNYLTLRSKDKFPRSSLRHVTHCLMVIHPHTKYHWTISRQKCYGPDKKLYLKNHYLTLMSKFMVPGRSLWYTTHRLVVMHPYQISLTYLKRNNYLTFRSKVKVQQRSLWYATHRLMVMHPHTKYHWPRKKQLFDLEVKGQGPNKGHYGTQHTSYGHAPTYQISLTYLERNHYLTLRSKIKIPGRSLWFKTHRLMDMHPC